MGLLNIIFVMVPPDDAKHSLRANMVFAIPLLFLILATIAIALRLYVRIFMTRSFGKDDAYLIAAYVRTHIFRKCLLEFQR